MSGDTVFAVASGKGGVGKTTTTVNLGTAIAAAGHRVAIVDADLGMANLAGFVNLTADDATLYDVLAGDADVESASYEVADGIVVVPSGTDLERYADVEVAGLTDVIDHLRAEFDYVLLDVGAGVSHETVLPLGLADSVIVVVTPEPGAVSDAEKTVDLVDRADGTTTGLVLNKTRLDDGVSDTDIATHIGVDLLASVPEDSLVRESLQAGTPLVAYEPESPASIGFRTLAATLLDDVPAPDISPMDALERSNAAEDTDEGEAAEADDEPTEEEGGPVLLDESGTGSSATGSDGDSPDTADEDGETEPPADILGSQAESAEDAGEASAEEPASGDAAEASAEEPASGDAAEASAGDDPDEATESEPNEVIPEPPDGDPAGEESAEAVPAADEDKVPPDTTEATEEPPDETPDTAAEPEPDDQEGVVIEDEDLDEDEIPFRAGTDDSVEFDDDGSVGFEEETDDSGTADADADVDSDDDEDDDSGGLLSRLLGR